MPQGGQGSRREKAGRRAPERIDFGIEMQVDLHGLRPSDALNKLDRHLERCFAAGLLVVHVVHGHGTGALREAVRDRLSRHPLVVRYRDGSYGMGGDGVTVVDLKRPPAPRRDTGRHDPL